MLTLENEDGLPSWKVSFLLCGRYWKGGSEPSWECPPCPSEPLYSQSQRGQQNAAEGFLSGAALVKTKGIHSLLGFPSCWVEDNWLESNREFLGHWTGRPKVAFLKWEPLGICTIFQSHYGNCYISRLNTFVCFHLRLATRLMHRNFNAIWLCIL